MVVLLGAMGVCASNMLCGSSAMTPRDRGDEVSVESLDDLYDGDDEQTTDCPNILEKIYKIALTDTIGELRVKEQDKVDCICDLLQHSNIDDIYKEAKVSDEARYVVYLIDLARARLLCSRFPDSEDRLLHEKTVILSGGWFDEDSINELVSFLKADTICERLIIRDCVLNDAQVGKISDALKFNKTIKKLIIENCNIGDEGLFKVADMLRENTTLVELSLAHNKIDTEGLFKIADMLQKNTTSVKLSLIK